MPSQQLDLVQYLAEKGIRVVGSIVRDSNGSEAFFVRVAVQRDADNRQQPSNRTLASIQSELLSLGKPVEFLLTDGLGQDIEGGLRATLIYAFGSDVRNVFFSLSGRGGRVWVEPKRTLEERAARAIEARAKEFLGGLAIELETFATTGDDSIPGNLACLRALRQIAPATVEQLKVELSRRQFLVPSEDWLNRRLDVLRKAGKVVRHAGGTFACTLTTIHALGTVKGRRSPDLDRLLALARQGR
ncbi:hypothetical protein ACFJGW_20655 [Burkholderiaceae bacterium UC74_6]